MQDVPIRVRAIPKSDFNYDEWKASLYEYVTTYLGDSKTAATYLDGRNGVIYHPERQKDDPVLVAVPDPSRVSTREE